MNFCVLQSESKQKNSKEFDHCEEKSAPILWFFYLQYMQQMVRFDKENHVSCLWISYTQVLLNVHEIVFYLRSF